MIKYTITFPFNGVYREITVDAGYLANRFLTLDADYDFPYDNELFPEPSFQQYDEDTKNFKKLVVEFNSDHTLNVAYPSDYEGDDELVGSYVEKNIPFLLLKVYDPKTLKEIYNCTWD